jgi:hypothetical protein
MKKKTHDPIETQEAIIDRISLDLVLEALNTQAEAPSNGTEECELLDQRPRSESLPTEK